MKCQDQCVCIPTKLIKQLQKKKFIEEIDLQKCNIEHTQDLRLIQSEIQKLYLQSNLIVNLVGLPNTLIFIDVSNNQIEDVKEIENLRNLYILRISNNLISTFDIKLDKLQLLDVSYNFLTKLPQQCQKLTSLNIQGNEMKDYITKAQSVFPRLQVLDGIHFEKSTNYYKIIELQEKQLVTKYNLNQDVLSQWRQEVFKQIVKFNSFKYLVRQQLLQIKEKSQIQISNQLNQKLDIISQRINKLYKHQMNSQKKIKIAFQKQNYDIKIIKNSIKLIINNEDDKISANQLVNLLQQKFQDLERQVYSINDQKELLQQENQLLKTQSEHFKQLYQQSKNMMQQIHEDQSSNKDRFQEFNQLCQNIRQLEDEKQQIRQDLIQQKQQFEIQILGLNNQLQQQNKLITQSKSDLLEQQNQFIQQLNSKDQNIQQLDLQLEKITQERDHAKSQNDHQIQLLNQLSINDIHLIIETAQINQMKNRFNYYTNRSEDQRRRNKSSLTQIYKIKEKNDMDIIDYNLKISQLKDSNKKLEQHVDELQQKYKNEQEHFDLLHQEFQKQLAEYKVKDEQYKKWQESQDNWQKTLQKTSQLELKARQLLELD
ncbi:hypothetical protein pb186bvf_013126 [Paramecium bursaria]